MKKIYIVFYCNTSKEYKRYFSSYPKINLDECYHCINKSPTFHYHGYYTPLTNDEKFNIILCTNCCATKVIFPTYYIDKKIKKYEIKLDITHYYNETEISYSKLGKKYNISKTHAYNIVKGFSNIDYNTIIQKIIKIEPEIDISSELPKELPLKKQTILEDTPAILLSSYRSARTIQIYLKILRKYYFIKKGSNTTIDKDIHGAIACITLIHNIIYIHPT